MNTMLSLHHQTLTDLKEEKFVLFEMVHIIVHCHTTAEFRFAAVCFLATQDLVGVLDYAEMHSKHLFMIKLKGSFFSKNQRFKEKKLFLNEMRNPG